jgi:hypothetical protein
MGIDLNRMTKRFLLGETKSAPSIRAYAESIAHILDDIRPKTQKESRQLSVARQHLQEIKKINRRLQEKISLLEEQVKILEEGK